MFKSSAVLLSSRIDNNWQRGTRKFFSVDCFSFKNAWREKRLLTVFRRVRKVLNFLWQYFYTFSCAHLIIILLTIVRSTTVKFKMTSTTVVTHMLIESEKWIHFLFSSFAACLACQLDLHQKRDVVRRKTSTNKVVCKFQ